MPIKTLAPNAVSRRIKNASPSPIEGYLTTAEISARSGVTQEHVTLLIRSKRLPAIRVGSIYLVKEADWKHYDDTRNAKGAPRGPRGDKN